MKDCLMAAISPDISGGGIGWRVRLIIDGLSRSGVFVG